MTGVRCVCRSVRIRETLEIANMIKNGLYARRLEFVVLLEKAERDMLPANGAFTRLGALGWVRCKGGSVRRVATHEDGYSWRTSFST
jgi:hypothetical protein